MADIDFGDGTWEEARGVIRQLLQDHEQRIHGNGKDGMLTTLTNFITEYRVDQKNLAERLKERDKTINRWVQICILAVAIATAWLTFHDSQRAAPQQPSVKAAQ